MTSPVVPQSCTGTNRLGRPCTNRVNAPGGWCGKCQAAALRPAAGGSKPPAEAPAAVIGPLLEQPATDESWSPAEQVRRRLASVAGDSPELQRLVEVGARLAVNSRAAQTKASYRQHWLTFERFCAAAGLSSALPVAPEVVALFVAFLTVYRRHDPSTGQRTETGKPLAHSYLRQAVASIGQRHINHGQADPTTDATIAVLLEGYGKTYGTAVRGKDPIRAAQLGTICLTLSQPPVHARRDLALCLLATDATLDLGPGQLAALDRSSIFLPEQPLEPLVLLVTRRGGPSLHPVEVWPNALTDICPVTAVQALVGTPHDGTDPKGGKAFGVTLEGVVHLVNDQVRRAGLTPVTCDRRLPRLDVEQRRVLAAAIAQPCDEDTRNRAILTSLYWGCLRGDELAQTRRHHLHLVDQGIEWTLPRAKNDQHGQGQVRGVPTNLDPWICPVTALTEWLERLAHRHGRPLQPEDPVFPGLGRPGTYTTPMTRDAISDVIKTTSQRAGLTGNFGSHSPRAGFATDALDDGIPREQVQAYGGWRNHRSLDSYYRRTHIWGTTNPANRLARLED